MAQGDKKLETCKCCGQAIIEPIPETVGYDSMVYVAGSKYSYYCDCGCNVFRKAIDDLNKFVCNSCRSVYRGEPGETKPSTKWVASYGYRVP